VSEERRECHERLLLGERANGYMWAECGECGWSQEIGIMPNTDDVIAAQAVHDQRGGLH
jgi:hypothetical protein